MTEACVPGLLVRTEPLPLKGDTPPVHHSPYPPCHLSYSTAQLPFIIVLTLLLFSCLMCLSSDHTFLGSNIQKG